MIYHYTCNHCIATKAGQPVTDLCATDYNRLAAQFIQEIEHGINETPEILCSICNNKMRRLIGIQAGYIRGYGLKDIRGAKNDMNLHSMVTGNDPYGEHRKPREASDLIDKLRRNKQYNPRARRVFVRHSPGI